MGKIHQESKPVGVRMRWNDFLYFQINIDIDGMVYTVNIFITSQGRSMMENKCIGRKNITPPSRDPRVRLFSF